MLYNRLTLEITLFALAFAGPLVWLFNGFVDIYQNTYQLGAINVIPLIFMAAAILGLFITSYVKLPDKLATYLMYLGVSIPILIDLIVSKIGIFIDPNIWYTFLYALGTYLILAATLALVENMGRLVPCEDRGKLSAIFILSTMLGLFIILFLRTNGISIYTDGISLLDIGVLMALGLSLLLKPWNFERHNYTVHGSPRRYAISWFFIGLSLITWYIHAHNLKIIVELSHHDFVPLGDLPVIASVIIAFSAFISGFLSDRLGRRQTATIGVLLLAGLSIYTPSFSGDPGLVSGLSLIQDFIFGYILGIGMFLIWGEIGSYLTKAKRIFYAWTYMIVLIGIAMFVHTNEFVFPLTLANFSLSLSITFGLIAFYPLAQAPEVLENEVEIEELKIKIDHGAVQAAVDDIIQEKALDEIVIGNHVELDKELDEYLSEAPSKPSKRSKSSRKVKTKKKTVKPTSIGDLPVTKIKGIGKVTAERMKRLGYPTIRAVSLAEPEDLSIQLKISLQRAKKIIKYAQDMIESEDQS